MSRASLCLIVSAAILFSFGLLMIFNTTAAQIIDRSLEVDTHTVLLKQLFYGLVGVCLGAAVYRWGHEALLKMSPYSLIGATVLLALLFVPGIGQTINGSRRWLWLWGVSFQPSEFVKVLIPAVYIQWYLRQTPPISFKPFLQILLKLAIPGAMILLQPDNGTAIILILCLGVLFFLTRIRWIYWCLPLLLLGSIGAAAAYRMPYVANRIAVYLHPELDLKGKGHQPHQAKIAAGSGKLFGRGFGESLQKLNYLPEARNDYIAAIWAEETGLVGVLILIGVYMTLTYSGFAIALNAKTQAAFLFASGLTFLIAIQAFLNLGIVSGLLPSKGMTLPFFSQGGTSLIVNIIALFILADISRKSAREWEYG
jgi:cell division protein FtsW